MNEHHRFSNASDQTTRMRNAAEVLLQRLFAERKASEQRLAELGDADPIKHVTGASALDRAIETTRRMLDQAEAALNEAHPEQQHSQYQNQHRHPNPALMIEVPVDPPRPHALSRH